MKQLEPGPGECVGELVRVFVEAFRDRPVDGIDSQRQVCRQHHRGVALFGVVRIRHGAFRLGIFRRPLLRARGARRQLPLVLEQVLQEPVVPLDRVVGPCAFEAAGDRVGALAGAVLVLPAQALLFDGGALGFLTDVINRRRGAMGLADRVAADDERNRLLVVHGHAGKGLADVPGGSERIGVAPRPFGIHVDQAHLHVGERLGEFAVTAVARVSQPCVLGTPEDVLGLPDVGPAETEAEGLEAHRFISRVAGQDQQVRPRDLAPVLFLDGPEQPARLVEVGVVGPAVEGREALLAFAASAAAVGNAVRPGGMPRHADEHRPVVTVVGRPPVLRRRHQCNEVAIQCFDVEGLELLRIVEVLFHRIRELRMPVQHREIQLVRPPVLVRVRPARAWGSGTGSQGSRFR